MAKAPNDIQSAIASATYTLPVDFSVTINPSSLNVQWGGSVTATVTVKDQGDFNSNVAFACSGLPQGATCTFTPEIVPTAAGTTYTALTVSAPTMTAAQRGDRGPLIPGSILAAAMCIWGWRKWRRVQLLLLAGCMAALGAFIGCAAVLHLETDHSTSTVTVTATSGSLSHRTTFTLMVN